jgi:hypothetical protein
MAQLFPWNHVAVVAVLCLSAFSSRLLIFARSFLSFLSLSLKDRLSCARFFQFHFHARRLTNHFHLQLLPQVFLLRALLLTSDLVASLGFCLQWVTSSGMNGAVYSP